MPCSVQTNTIQDTKLSVLKISSYDGKTIKGVLSNQYYETEQPFENAIQLLLLMENAFDNTVPQSSFDSRSFQKNWSKASCVAEEPRISDDKGCIEAFAVNVIFRQNASWQGTIARLGKKDEASFRSALELLLLMDSALTE